MKPATEPELALSYRAATQAPVGRPGCPDAGSLAALAAEPGPPALRPVLEHVAGCSACSEELREALALESWAREATSERLGQEPAARILPFRRWLPTLAAAAVLLLGVGLTRGFRGVAPAPADVVRGDAPSPAGEVFPADGSTLPEPPTVLTWSAPRKGLTFRVTLLDAGGAPLWRSGPLSSPAVGLPERIRARVAGGGTVYWRVESSDALVEWTSPTYTLRVIP